MNSPKESTILAIGIFFSKSAPAAATAKAAPITWYRKKITPKTMITYAKGGRVLKKLPAGFNLLLSSEL